MASWTGYGRNAKIAAIALACLVVAVLALWALHAALTMWSERPVRVAILPGLTAELPPDGYSCDPGIAAALGGKTLPPRIAALCESPAAKPVAIYLTSDSTTVLLARDGSGQKVELAFHVENGAQKDTMREIVCQNIVHHTQVPVSECDLENAKIDGADALIARAAAPSRTNPDNMEYSRAALMPYRGGFATVAITVIAPGANPPPDADGLFNRIVASIKFAPQA